jgi:hypothetical protein
MGRSVVIRNYYIKRYGADVRATTTATISVTAAVRVIVSNLFHHHQRRMRSRTVMGVLFGIL